MTPGRDLPLKARAPPRIAADAREASVGMTEPSLPPQSLLKGFSGFLLWVGSSLAGITALLYSCGYLVLRAHLSMLGLYGLVEQGADDFLQEGAKFVLGAGYEVLRTLLPLAAVVGLAALLAVSVMRALRQTRLAAAVARLRGRALQSGAWRYALFGALFVALLMHADRYLDAFERPLAVVNLLYADRASAASASPGSAAELAAWLLANNSAALSRQFDDLLIGLIIAALLVFAAWRVVRPLPMRPWLVAPFAVAALMYLVTLPMAYGVLKHPVRYALVSFADAQGVARGDGRMFLLAKSGEAFVLWDAGAGRVVWVPVDGVKRAEIRGVADLFGTDGPAEARQ